MTLNIDRYSDMRDIWGRQMDAVGAVEILGMELQGVLACEAVKLLSKASAD